jgi:DNA-directed RNA polymerase specialized sigma24 family protein
VSSVSGRVIRRAHLLSRLDVAERRILQLVYLDGLSIERAGVSLGLARTAAVQLCRTARHHLHTVAYQRGGVSR